MQTRQIQQTIQKLRALPPERIVEVDDFIDFLKTRDQDRSLVRATMGATESVLETVWDNPDDAEYDRL